MATKVKLIADNVITTDQIDLTSINTDNLSEGSTNLYFTNARVDSHLSGGTGVTYSSGEISIGQAVATDSNVTFADLTVTGDLNITGDINSYNVTDLDVTDQTITLGVGQIEANSGGSGIIIDGSGASLLWNETNNQFDFNKTVNVTSGNMKIDGNQVGLQHVAQGIASGNSVANNFQIGRWKGSTFDRWMLVPVNNGSEQYSDEFGYNFNTGAWFFDDKLGIGIADADSKLHISGTTITGGIFVEDSSTASSSPVIKVQGKRSDANKSQSFSGGLVLESLYTGGLAPDTKHTGTIYFGINHTDGTASNIAYSASISGILEGDANSASDMPTGLVFYTGDAGTALGAANTTYGTERMRIDSSGNVGINNPDPDEKLHISGGGIKIDGEATIASGSGTGLFLDYASNVGRITALDQGVVWRSLRLNAADIQFYIANGQKMVLDSSGNVGIAATPSGEAAAAHVVRLGDRVCISEYDDGSNPEQFNLLHNSDSSETYIETGYATNIQQRNGEITFKTAASGTAGAAITFSDKVKILNNGNVGIGNSNPQGRLSISGPNTGSQPVVDITATGTGTFQRGVRMLNSGMNSGDHIMYALGRSDNARNMGQTYFYFDSAGSTSNRISMGLHSVDDVFNITGTGNVGIDTTSPQEKLHVEGSVLIDAYNQGAEEGIFFRQGFSSSNKYNMGIMTYAHNGSSNDGITIGAYNGFSVSTGSNTRNERFRISSTGAVSVVGSLSKGSGSFKIDHPLESKTDTHHLVHSFIEGPQADLIYRGKVDLVDGSATVNIDTVAGMTEGTFVALNREVQCFTSNESDWDAVKGSVSGNILTIECQNVSSTATVSWLVIGERQDPHMYDTEWTDEDGKVIVEPLKETTAIEE